VAIVAAGGAGVFSGGITSVSAQGQSSATMLVTATVVRKCVIQTMPMDFGTYDAIAQQATAALDAQATITVACTKGTTISVAIDDGLYDRARTRRMADMTRDFLDYELYKDPSRTQRWGSRRDEVYDGGVAPSRDPRAFIVYGRVPGGQDVAPGTFIDMVVVTVEF
jgi:spore coat protein U-like protein